MSENDIDVINPLISGRQCLKIYFGFQLGTSTLFLALVSQDSNVMISPTLGICSKLEIISSSLSLRAVIITLIFWRSIAEKMLVFL